MKKMMMLVLLFSSIVSAWANPAEFGEASYYSDKFHGKPTASGELYDYNKLTAAHKTLPFGTLIKVTRTDNNKSITVKVNDRGPYIAGRIVDLSRAAAQAIGLLDDGTANVKVEVVQRPESEDTSPPVDRPIVDIKPEAPPTYNEPDPVIATPRPQRVIPKPAPAPPKPEKKATPNVAASKPEIVTPKSAPPAAEVKTKSKSTIPGSYKDFGLYEVQISKPEKRGFAVQVALLSTYDNALQTIVDLQNKWFDNVLLSIEPDREGVAQYKVLLGPFPDRSTANGYKDALKKNKKMDGFVVDLERARY